MLVKLFNVPFCCQVFLPIDQESLCFCLNHFNSRMLLLTFLLPDYSKPFSTSLNQSKSMKFPMFPSFFPPKNLGKSQIPGFSPGCRWIRSNALQQPKPVSSRSSRSEENHQPWTVNLVVSGNGTPEWMVYIMENLIFSWFKIDDLKVPQWLWKPPYR